MGAALSLDLRRRVIAAVEAGTSCRQAAARFGVGVATAIRWQAQLRREGDIAAKRMGGAGQGPRQAKLGGVDSGGGDRTSHRIEAHAALILKTCEARPQLFLRELRDLLREHGVQTSISGLARFFARHGITRKKGRSTRPSKNART